MAPRINNLLVEEDYFYKKERNYLFYLYLGRAIYANYPQLDSGKIVDYFFAGWFFGMNCD